MDRRKSSWLKAIQNDKMNWTNVSDLKGWKDESSPAHKYNITDIPFNFLLDPDGKIIAKRLRGKNIEDKLAELLK